MVSTRSKTGATPARSPLKTISKKRHSKHPASPRSSAPVAFPDVSLHNDTGIVVSTHSLLTDAAPGLILFTYPRANTGGCTTQAKGLSALREPALAAGYNIVGCSYDSVKTQASWKVKSSISLMLLSDTPSSGLLRKLSVHKAPRSVRRSVFVITRKGDTLDIVLAKRAVSPKECIALMEQYIKDNPLKPSSAKSDADHAMTDDKPQPQQTPPASTPAAPRATDAAKKADEPKKAEEPEDKQPPEQPKQADQPMEAEQTANHANADQPAPKEAAAAAPPAEQTNHVPADASKSKSDETANKSTAAGDGTQPTTTDKSPEADLSSKEQKDATDAKPEEKAEEKMTATTEKPVVMDVEKPKEEGKA